MAHYSEPDQLSRFAEIAAIPGGASLVHGVQMRDHVHGISR
jgi:hypothetical protein